MILFDPDVLKGEGGAWGFEVSKFHDKGFGYGYMAA